MSTRDKVGGGTRAFPSNGGTSTTEAEGWQFRLSPTTSMAFPPPGFDPPDEPPSVGPGRIGRTSHVERDSRHRSAIPSARGRSPRPIPIVGSRFRSPARPPGSIGTRVSYPKGTASGSIFPFRPGLSIEKIFCTSQRRATRCAWRRRPSLLHRVSTASTRLKTRSTTQERTEMLFASMKVRLGGLPIRRSRQKERSSSRSD